MELMLNNPWVFGTLLIMMLLIMLFGPLIKDVFGRRGFLIFICIPFILLCITSYHDAPIISKKILKDYQDKVAKKHKEYTEFNRTATIGTQVATTYESNTELKKYQPYASEAGYKVVAISETFWDVTVIYEKYK